MKKFETFEHGADVGIRGYGKTLEEAFSNILLALLEVMVEDFKEEELKAEKKLKITLHADEVEELLVMFVNRAISLCYTEDLVFFKFEGRITQNQKFKLEGDLLGESFKEEKFGYGVEVKGATFTMAKVYKQDDFWVCQCVIDV